MQTRLPGPGAQLMAYRYDQLNRIKQSRAYGPGGAALAAGETDRYAEEFWYDPNGNLTRATRYGANNSSQTDNLTYTYQDPANTNRLGHVGNTASGGIAPQTAGNYAYDEIGNLVQDRSEGITGIDWTVYGKVAAVLKNTGGAAYRYDAAGQRISKQAGSNTTFYVRDASGNTMAVYLNGALQELHIYGSSRIGVYRAPGTDLQAERNRLTLGRREYELANHLGNVLATVSDAKLPAARVLSHTDYYAFGSAMAGRTGTPGGGGYRYGFNGKEDDGETGWQDYGLRLYDPRLARFFTVDPITASYPMLTPYQFASNRPIDGIDLDGLEWEPVRSYRPPGSTTPAKLLTYRWVGFVVDHAKPHPPIPFKLPMKAPAGSVPYAQMLWNENNQQHARVFATEGNRPKVYEQVRTPWVSIARSEMAKEVAENTSKTESDPEVMKYLQHESIIPNMRGANDKVFWCAAFVNYCLEVSGYEGGNPRNELAVGNWNGTWAKWEAGVQVSRPTYGAIVTLGDDHIGIVVGMKGKEILILGGNQDNAVNVISREIKSNFKFFLPKGYKPTPSDSDEKYLQTTYKGPISRATSTQ